MKIKPVHFLVSLFAASPALAMQPIVGSWLIDDPDGHILATFLEDGTYLVALDIDGDATHTGVEWGAYTWNSAPGPDYGLITAIAQGDTNGDWGIANDVDGPVKFAVSGDSATVSSPLAADPLAHVYSASRIPHIPGTIVGSWTIPGEPVVSVNLFADGTYILGEAGTADADGGPGIERGSYSWNPVTGEFTAFNVLTDTSGGWGLWDSGSGTANALTVMVSGANTLLATNPGEPAFTLTAVVPEPSSYAMLLAGLGLTAMVVRQKGRMRV